MLNKLIGGIIAASNPENVQYHGRLEPGKMFLVDMNEGRIVNDEEIKEDIASRHPYRKWLDENLVHLRDLKAKKGPIKYDEIEFLDDYLIKL